MRLTPLELNPADWYVLIYGTDTLIPVEYLSSRTVMLLI